MLARQPLIALLIFLVATAYVLYRFVLPSVAADATYLQNSIAPELLGLCLDGVLFVGLFELLSSWREHRSKENLRRILNDTLSTVARDLNEGAVASVEAHIWSLRMDSSKSHHGERSKIGLQTLEPFFEQINTPQMKVGLNAFYTLLDFLASPAGEPFRSIVYLWAMTGFDVAKQVRLEGFYSMAALESPSTLAKWSELLRTFKACTCKPHAFPSAELRALGKYLEATEI